jgi:threonylcarbamoyladenosine tRNA methylthiotransferase MtaB
VTQKVAFKTIGCKVNQYETGTLNEAFSRNGYQIVEFQEKADIYIINTCAVTAEAERKSKQMIRKAAKLNPLSTIIVTGCAAQSGLQDIQGCKNISLLVSNYYKENIFNLINKTELTKGRQSSFIQSAVQITNYAESEYYSNSNRIRGMVKIQDGCNQFCSYCIIPYLRGRARSRSSQKILSEISHLASQGYKEVVLLGINLGSYGTDLIKEKINLANLLTQIENITGLARIRLSSIELPYITKELISAFTHSQKFCHHLHIPLQSGDNRILSLMRRKYNSKQYEKTINTLRKNMPDIAITTDVIVGFPGEDDISFEETFQLIKKIGFSKIHVFPYSERILNLSSFLPDKTDINTIKNRSKKIINLSTQLGKDYLVRNVGKEKNVLVEGQRQQDKKSFVLGLTDNYIKVYIYNLKVPKGQLIKVKLIEAKDNYMVGEPV